MYFVFFITKRIDLTHDIEILFSETFLWNNSSQNESHASENMQLRTIALYLTLRIERVLFRLQKELYLMHNIEI